jgi:hypothetical protein
VLFDRVARGVASTKDADVKATDKSRIEALAREG